MSTPRRRAWVSRVLWPVWFLALGPIGGVGSYALGATRDPSYPQQYPARAATPGLAVGCLGAIVVLTAVTAAHQCRAWGVMPRAWRWATAFLGSFPILVAVEGVGMMQGPGEFGLMVIAFPIVYLFIGAPALLVLRVGLGLGCRPTARATVRPASTTLRASGQGDLEPDGLVLGAGREPPPVGESRHDPQTPATG
jgi:hypothetical protein